MADSPANSDSRNVDQGPPDWLAPICTSLLVLLTIAILAIEDFSSLETSLERILVFGLLGSGAAMSFAILLSALKRREDPNRKELDQRRVSELRMLLLPALLVTTALGMNAWQQAGGGSISTPTPIVSCCPHAAAESRAETEHEGRSLGNALPARITAVTDLLSKVSSVRDLAVSPVVRTLEKAGGSALESFTSTLAAGVADRLLAEADKSVGSSPSTKCLINKAGKRFRMASVVKNSRGDSGTLPVQWRVTGTILCD